MKCDSERNILLAQNQLYSNTTANNDIVLTNLQYNQKIILGILLAVACVSICINMCCCIGYFRKRKSSKKSHTKSPEKDDSATDIYVL